MVNTEKLNIIAKKRSKKGIIKQWIRRHFRWIIVPIQNIQLKYYSNRKEK